MTPSPSYILQTENYMEKAFMILSTSLEPRE